MYSQASISSHHRGSRSAPTEETLSGLTCAICGLDYRTAPDAEAVLVSRGAEGSTVACQGVCARMASGSATGLDETPPPLAERVRRYETAVARKQGEQAQDEQPGSDA
ncbi:hypothetical protein [Streptomyces sp. NPDC006552]|uniref:hypothetical protein n=1 Tax=Streptomyces sp. NPDC006552 TaxID=3157179 RepID=UPI0033A94673